MRLSSGLRFGSQLEERIPVPQLSASVFLQSKYHSQPLEGTQQYFSKTPCGPYSYKTQHTKIWNILHIWKREDWFHLCLVIFYCTALGISDRYTLHLLHMCNVLDLSKKAARRRLSKTLCLTPAQRWQFISCPRVMKTPDPSTAPTTEKQGDLSSASVT